MGWPERKMPQRFGIGCEATNAPEGSDMCKLFDDSGPCTEQELLLQTAEIVRVEPDGRHLRPPSFCRACLLYISHPSALCTRV